MIREGREVSSWTDYILGTYRRLFGNVSVRDPRHNSDHYMVLVCLHSAPLREYSRYIGGRKRLPLLPPTAPTREDGIFEALQRAVSKPLERGARKNAWIAEATWRLVDDKVSARRDPTKDRAFIRRLGRTIAASLRDDMQRRVEVAGAEVEALIGLDPPIHRKYWQWIKGWYRAAVDRSPPPNRVTLEQITVDWVDLYSYVPPPGENIPISVEPFPVDDSVPTEDEIEWAVKRLRNHCSGGPQVMRAEHLKMWLAESRKSEKEETAVGEETMEGK